MQRTKNMLELMQLKVLDRFSRLFKIVLWRKYENKTN